MFVGYGSEWELMMTCSQRYRGDTRHEKYEQISEITDNQESSLLAHFQSRIEPLVTCYPGLDYENCGVISQIFTGCKWELICTLLTLIGKQIEELHCQLSLARDGATDNQRINTRQNTETVGVPRECDWLHRRICSPSIVCHFRLLSRKLAKTLFIAGFFAHTILNADFHWSFSTFSCLKLLV